MGNYYNTNGRELWNISFVNELSTDNEVWRIMSTGKY